MTASDDLGRGEGAGNDHFALDPHVWLDPTLLVRIARVVESRLTTIDPEHATDTAFGYLAQRYHLTQIAVSGLSPDSEPSPARIAEVQGLARDHGLTTIFSETLVSPAVAEAIAGDLGLVTDVLDPTEGITDQSRGHDYLSVMAANLAALRKAGGCS